MMPHRVTACAGRTMTLARDRTTGPRSRSLDGGTASTTRRATARRWRACCRGSSGHRVEMGSLVRGQDAVSVVRAGSPVARDATDGVPAEIAASAPAGRGGFGGGRIALTAARDRWQPRPILDQSAGEDEQKTQRTNHHGLGRRPMHPSIGRTFSARHSRNAKRRRTTLICSTIPYKSWTVATSSSHRTRVHLSSPRTTRRRPSGG
jgi:hypothetical protein